MTYSTPDLTYEILERDIMSVESHVLIAGSTGSGKSNLLRRCLCYAAHKGFHLILIDPKGTELGPWKDGVNCAGYAEYPADMIDLLGQTVETMEDRIHSLPEYQRTYKGTPLWVVIDEYADLMDTAPQAAKLVKRLAQKGRAAGIHVLLCTQHPSAKVIDGTIKANFPARIALHTASALYSRMIIERNGAESLPYKGYAYFMHESGDIDLYQTSLLPDEEEIRVCEYMKAQGRATVAAAHEPKKSFWKRLFG